MYLRGSGRVEQISTALGIIRCGGTTAEGAPCPAILEVALYEKGECPVCGWSVQSYTAYCAVRSVEKIA